MSLGEKIKNYITERGIKQTFLAEKAGIPDSTMSKILSGQLDIAADKYYLICKTLGLSADYFFEDEVE